MLSKLTLVLLSLAILFALHGKDGSDGTANAQSFRVYGAEGPVQNDSWKYLGDYFGTYPYISNVKAGWKESNVECWRLLGGKYRNETPDGDIIFSMLEPQSPVDISFIRQLLIENNEDYVWLGMKRKQPLPSQKNIPKCVEAAECECHETDVCECGIARKSGKHTIQRKPCDSKAKVFCVGM